MTDYEREILAKAKAAVLAVEPTAEIILFGSRSRGDANEESDFDLLVLTERDPVIDVRMEFWDALLEVNFQTGELLEPIVISKNRWLTDDPPSPLMDSVREEGIPV